MPLKSANMNWLQEYRPNTKVTKPKESFENRKKLLRKLRRVGEECRHAKREIAEPGLSKSLNININLLRVTSHVVRQKLLTTQNTWPSFDRAT